MMMDESSTTSCGRSAFYSAMVLPISQQLARTPRLQGRSVLSAPRELAPVACYYVQVAEINRNLHGSCCDLHKMKCYLCLLGMLTDKKKNPSVYYKRRSVNCGFSQKKLFEQPGTNK